MNKKRRNLWTPLYGLALALFTLYVVLDAFVIPRSYAAVQNETTASAIVQSVGGGTASQSTTGTTSQSASGTTSQSTSGTTSQSTTGTTSQSTAGTTSQSTSGTTSQSTSGTASQSTSGTTAQSTTGTTSQSASGTTSQSTSGTTSQSTSGTASQSTSGTASQSTTGTAASSAASQTPVVTADSYSDGSIAIQITTYRVDDTDVYVADVTLASADALKTALANDVYGKNITAATSSIAAAHDAILAINGDYYSARSGYMIRNGVLYRSTSGGSDQEDLVVWADGSFEIVTEGSVTAQQLLDRGAWQVFAFGPALVTGGEISVSQGEEVDQAKTSNPRTAIGIIDDLHYVFVVADGRTSASAGLSLYQLADFLKSLGVQTAYNLDGGGSSTMVFNGTVVNNPTTNGTRISERKVSDIVYIG